MKNYKYIFSSCLLLVSLCFSCVDESVDLGPVPTSSDATFTFKVSEENPNVIEFTNTSVASIAHWDFGNGETAKGNTVQGIYAEAGSYEVTLTIVTKSGQASNKNTIVIDQTDYSLVDIPDYNFLTGGAEALNGKVWKFSRYVEGHQGRGVRQFFYPNEWIAKSLEKEGFGHYDDELIFSQYDLKYELKNNGDAYVNNNALAAFTNEFGGTVSGGSEEDGWKVDVTVNAQDWTWKIERRGAAKYLVISDNAYLSWYTGAKKEFEIMELTENRLYLRVEESDNFAWYYEFRPKEIADKEIPKDVKPLDSQDLFDDFSGNGNIGFETSGALEFLEAFPNIDFNGNDAETVGRYTRKSGTGENTWYQNYTAELPYRLDLSERNTFTLKVYCLPSNDFETISPAASNAEGLGDMTLSPTVSLRLEDSTDGENSDNAEVVYTLTEDELGRWVELTFDFSAYADQDKYDRLTLQFGGEGHTLAGTVYFSSFELNN
ncbi:PKD domain-containing protein [Sediminitomix flava]|uniref:PKD domain-containing protein n=1 Tax=Sediminitomix flava TaxID=379075 RepID=A0A315ZC64_SEDFL|nr:PKD domain-containing protein [Sediminitomix flava]PWJ42910.1 PKD domain-containing protein [Sediminitomix flava]